MKSYNPFRKASRSSVAEVVVGAVGVGALSVGVTVAVGAVLTSDFGSSVSILTD